MVKLKGQTILNRDNRQRILEAHIAHREAQGKPDYTIDELQTLLRIAGYAVSRATVYNDLDDLARNDTFVSDLAAKTYSKIMHQCFNDYQRIKKEAMKVYNADIHNTRTINKGSGKDPGIDIIDETSGHVKLQALQVYKMAVDSQRLMVNGENLRVSASKWIQTSKEQQATIENLKAKLAEMEKNTIKNTTE